MFVYYGRWTQLNRYFIMMLKRARAGKNCARMRTWCIGNVDDNLSRYVYLHINLQRSFHASLIFFSNTEISHVRSSLLSILLLHDFARIAIADASVRIHIFDWASTWINSIFIQFSLNDEFTLEIKLFFIIRLFFYCCCCRCRYHHPMSPTVTWTLIVFSTLQWIMVSSMMRAEHIWVI